MMQMVLKSKWILLWTLLQCGSGGVGLIAAAAGVDSDPRVRDQITVPFTPIENVCFRLLNGTSTVGCQSSRLGDHGAVYRISAASDISAALDALPWGVDSIIALVSASDIASKRGLIEALRVEEKVAGILIYYIEQQHQKQAPSFPSGWSEDSACPNEIFSYYRNEHHLQNDSGDNGGSNSKRCTREWNGKWALDGEDGLRFLNFDKPMFLLRNETEIQRLTHGCYERYNWQRDGSTAPVCMASMRQFMFAAGNAPTCIRRQDSKAVWLHLSADNVGERLCDPLEDRNVFALLPAMSKKDVPSSSSANLFVLAARLDAFSTFTASHGGELSTLSALLPLLAVADAIGKHLRTFNSAAKQSPLGRHLAIALLHGESLGYIGSQRWLWEMQQGVFPMPPKNFTSPSANIRQWRFPHDFALYMEVQQLSTASAFHLHTDGAIYQRTAGKASLDAAAASMNASLAASGRWLEWSPNAESIFPPASYHTLMRASAGEGKAATVPGLLLSSFEKDYELGLLNSIFDTGLTDHPEGIQGYLSYWRDAADALLATTLNYVLANSTGQVKSKFRIRDSYIAELADCFGFKNSATTSHRYEPAWSCPLFKALLNSTTKARVARDFHLARRFYIGPAGEESLLRRIVHALLVRSLGEWWPTARDEASCRRLNAGQNVHRYVWQNDFTHPTNSTSPTIIPHCYRTSIYSTLARSPAFDIPDYEGWGDGGATSTPAQYSTWMESVWEEKRPQLELYLKAPFVALDLPALLVAALVMLLSTLLWRFFPSERWFLEASAERETAVSTNVNEQMNLERAL